MKTKLTKRVVDSTKPGQRDTFIWDVDVPGFGLKVTPAGKRVYVLQFRMGGRKSPWRYTIGQHGEYTTDRARGEATRLRGLIADGINPATQKAAARAQGLLMRDLVAQFLEEHVRTRRKSRTVVEYDRICRNFIVPQLGNIPVRELTRSDVARLHHAMRDTPYQANRILAVLSKAMNWAEMKGHRQDGSNPCRHVERYDEKKRERYLSPAEIGSLAKALSQAETEGLTSPYVIAAIRLLLLTGARLNEILTLKWEYVDIDQRCLRLPDSKTGSKVIHLNPPALEVLQSLPAIEGNPHVVIGNRTGAHLVNVQKPWRRIRKLAVLDDVRLHDLRHSFASLGAGAGLGLPMIGALLGHSQPATTARYAHLADDPLKSANDLIGQRITDAMRDADDGAVVPLRGDI